MKKKSILDQKLTKEKNNDENQPFYHRSESIVLTNEKGRIVFIRFYDRTVKDELSIFVQIEKELKTTTEKRAEPIKRKW